MKDLQQIARLLQKALMHLRAASGFVGDTVGHNP